MNLFINIQALSNDVSDYSALIVMAYKFLRSPEVEISSKSINQESSEGSEIDQRLKPIIKRKPYEILS